MTLEAGTADYKRRESSAEDTEKSTREPDWINDQELLPGKQPE
jgi:hypothetical protein